METSTAWMFSINPSSGTPIYAQIVDQVRQLAVSGRLAAGDNLPSVRSMAAQYDINPMTVSKAYAILKREGVVRQDRGKPMVVTETSVDPLKAIRPQATALVETVVRLGLSRADMNAAIAQVWVDLQERRDLGGVRQTGDDKDSNA